MTSKILDVATEGEIASRRVLRLALGVTLSLVFSQAINWPMSYIAPIFTLIILGLPLPAPSFRTGINFMLALMLPVCAGIVFLLPFFEYARSAGILLVTLALFGNFYYAAYSGATVRGMLMTVGLTVTIAVGSVSINALLAVTAGLALCAISGLAFVWIAHAFLPELPMERGSRPKPALPSRAEARRSALRSMVIVLPLAIFFLFSGSSASYVAIMIKVASMGQQAEADTSRKMGRAQIESTVWGGLVAIIAWQFMSIWPSLLMYGLLIALSGLLFGSRIFVGKGMHPKASMWSYAFLTMIVVLAPALLDGQSSDGASAAFYSRLFLFIIIAIYGSLSVIVFDSFWPMERDSAVQGQPEAK